jgi:hypothetical protein
VVRKRLQQLYTLTPAENIKTSVFLFPLSLKGQGESFQTGGFRVNISAFAAISHRLFNSSITFASLYTFLSEP